VHHQLASRYQNLSQQGYGHCLLIAFRLLGARCHAATFENFEGSMDRTLVGLEVAAAEVAFEPTQTKSHMGVGV
jgi:hypothetical protein